MKGPNKQLNSKKNDLERALKARSKPRSVLYHKNVDLARSFQRPHKVDGSSSNNLSPKPS